MIELKQSQTNDIPFVLVDAGNTEVPGLGTTWTVTVRKEGGAFVGSAGVKSELGNGWYNYRASAAECDTAGAIALLVSGAGFVQQNLLAVVSDTAGALDALAAAGVEFVGPVVDGGNVITYLGDDYNDLDGRALSWSSAAWPALTAATVAVTIDGLATFAGAVVTPTGTVEVMVELTAVQTASITAGRRPFQVVATQADGDIVTLVDAIWISRSKAEV